MESIAFPNILTNAKTMLYSDREATISNLRLLLLSDKTSLLGDPYFGTNLKKLIFEQGSVALRDIIIDDIYTAILTFMPQLQLTRDNIDVSIEDQTVTIEIRCINKLNFQTDLYIIKLTDGDFSTKR
jgi:phage baseplate assembly protein W